MEEKCLLLLVCVWAAAGYEIVDVSPSATVLEGDSLRLRCDADTEFFTCTWHHVQSGRKCTMLSGSLEGRNTCQSDPRYSWDVTEPTSCELVISEASREDDDGEHRCTLIFFDDGGPMSDIANVTVNVLKTPAPRIMGQFDVEEEGKVALVADREVEVECRVRDAFPLPEVSVFLFDSDGESAMMEMASEPLLMENEDGTFDANYTAVFAPQPSDCGKEVCCGAEYATDGMEEDAQLVSTCTKIMVQFPPQPREALGPYGYSVGDPEIVVPVRFMANPVPTDEQTIWHVVPGEASPVGSETLAFRSGSEHPSGKFEALPLNVSGHEVTATVVIYDLGEADSDFEYVLKVTTDLGEESYSFRIQSDLPYVSPYDDGDDLARDGSSDPKSSEVQEGGVGTGTIVGIVIVVVAIAGIALLVFWAKSKDKLCFKPTTELGEKKEKKKKKKKGGDEDAEVGEAVAPHLMAEVEPLNQENVPERVVSEGDKVD